MLLVVPGNSPVAEGSLGYPWNGDHGHITPNTWSVAISTADAGWHGSRGIGFLHVSWSSLGPDHIDGWDVGRSRPLHRDVPHGRIDFHGLDVGG